MEAKCSEQYLPAADRYLSDKLLSVLGAAYTASSRLVMEATHAYRATSNAAWEQFTVQHPHVSDMLQSQARCQHQRRS